jgi:phosphatidylglycerophosphatase A
MVVTVLGTGFSPIAPATVASALTCIILWFTPALLRWPWFLLLIPLTWIGIKLSDRAIIAFEVVEHEKFAALRRPNPHKGDPDQVTFDEFIGQWITLIPATHSILMYALAFFVFRFFDIVKPLGIKKVQSKNGFGVMIDDVLAGIAGAAVMWGVSFVWR